MDKVEMSSPHLRKRISGQLQEVALASLAVEKGTWRKSALQKGKGKGLQLMGKGTHKGGFKGKGFDKGRKDQGSKGSKGIKGSGKGPAGGCWTCGGPHFANECPHTIKAEPCRWRSGFRVSCKETCRSWPKSLRLIEPPEEKPTVASSKNKLPERQPSQDAPSPPSPQVARSNTPAQRRAAQEEAGSSCCCTHGGDNCSGRPWTVVVVRKKKKDLGPCQ